MPEPREGHFVLGRRDPLFFDAASDGHEEERGPHRDPLPGEQLGDGVDLVEIPPGDRRVDLDGHPQSPGVGQHAERPLEAAFPAAKSVVRRGVGAVEADPQPPHARRADPLERLGRGQRRRRRGQRHLQARGHRVADQVAQVRAFQRVAAGQHEHRPPRERRHLLDQGHRLLGGQLVRIGLLLRRRPAMLADQIAGQRHLVVEHQRIAVEIRRRVRGVGHEW